MPLRRKLVSRALDGETVVLDSEAGHVHQLNATASCIWQSCDGTRTAEEIAVIVADRFEASAEHVLPDVLAALRELAACGLLCDPS